MAHDTALVALVLVMSLYLSRCAPYGALLLLVGCAFVPAERAFNTPPSNPVVWRCGIDPGAPEGWTPWKVRRDKRETAYTVVVDAVPQSDGEVRDQSVLKAVADRSASGLRRELTVDLVRAPILQWQWKVVALIPSADNTLRDREDSPARLILAFDGDRSRLPMRERILAEQAKLLTGNDLPYATLMYIWENRKPEGTVIANAYTDRVKMVVAQSGGAAVGRWQWRERDVVADFERAFGEAPGRLLGISVMTDTDNTGERTVAYYGDFRFLAPPASSKD